MKLLLDANLSWRLTSVLSEYFGECVHVNKTELPIRVGNIDRKTAEKILLQSKSSILELENSNYGLLEII